MKDLHIKTFVLCLLFLFGMAMQNSFAQKIASKDSARVFALKDLEEIIFYHHPIVKQAGLLSEEARAKVMQAWGSFDPTVKSHFARKTFGNTEYYNNWSNELKIPIWLAGADLKIGYDRFVGKYTNPETQTSLPGLTGLGLAVPIGQGFLIDARRNTLRQSKIMVNYAEAEQIKQINKVWFDAVKDYWSWFNAYRQYTLVQEGADIALKRLEAVKRQTLMGDKPPIDSVEAAITYQERSLQLEKIRVDMINTRLLLSNHLWSAGAEPLELPEYSVPQEAEQRFSGSGRAEIDLLLSNAALEHPELLMLRTKGLQLQLEKQYQKELLKPKLSVSASLLTSQTAFAAPVLDDYQLQWGNYKVGIDFSFPLFVREQRGKIRQVKIKQLALEYDLQQTGREISTGIVNAYNQLKAYEAQLTIQRSSVENQQTLLRGELAKFDLGESTLFLINSRETKLIDMRLKLAELVSDYQKSVAELYYVAGTSQNNTRFDRR